MRKIALVKMQGGLGNQIFALNFINYLEMLNFNVYTSVKFYKNTQSSSINTERRDLHLDIDVLKLKFMETLIIVLVSFIVGVFIAYIYVFVLGAPLLKEVFLGGQNLQNTLSFVPVLDFSDLVPFFLFTQYLSSLQY